MLLGAPFILAFLIAPDFIEYPLQLPVGMAQVMMANTVSLLPGILSADLNHSVLIVHVLDGKNNVKKELEVIEKQIKQVFGFIMMNRKNNRTSNRASNRAKFNPLKSPNWKGCVP